MSNAKDWSEEFDKKWNFNDTLNDIDTHEEVKAFITKTLQERTEDCEAVLDKTWCDYPTSKDQEEHEKNMKIVNEAEAQAKLIVSEHFRSINKPNN